ncbi:hypothetical protein [Streptomyces sp. bgisy032]|uniref:hypothetical protein n=1 Tax=Streptomyces sp. bgisy032 TaxID=3413773 RepID=UPI003D711F48
MRRPVDGEVHVHYGQIYVESDPDGDGPGLAEAFAGQSGGLCGAAAPGTLWLRTGLHTGDVGFTVEVHEQAPPLDPEWEDVVEVSFRPLSTDSMLVQWAGEAAWPLGLEETGYRVRYCAQGMDRAHHEDTRLGEEPQLDRYLLQFWPAPPEPDRVLKQTSWIAAHCHAYARDLPPPPTPAERAETERRARLARETAERERLLALERREWGGKPPSEALRGLGGDVRGLRAFAPDLLHALDAAGPATRRAVALLAARRACEVAGLTALDWVADALTALDEGRPLPPPFGDDTRMWQTLASDPRLPDRTVGRAVPPGPPPVRQTGSPGTAALSVDDAAVLVTGPARGAARPPDLSESGESAEPADSPELADLPDSPNLPDPGEPADLLDPPEPADPVSRGLGPAVTFGLSDPGKSGELADMPDPPGPADSPELPDPPEPADPVSRGLGPAVTFGPLDPGEPADLLDLPDPPEPADSPERPDPPEPADPVSRGLGLALTFGAPDPSLRYSQPHMALPAVTAAAAPDPLAAAVDAVYAAIGAYGEHWPALLAEVRAVCAGRKA